MSKMDSMLNSKREKQSIYEIYRACRLCGAGAGYKMPIIQNVVDLDDSDVELKQKIRECVQIEVHQDDKMPPLICELCVDKVNDFYEFLEMCRQTNKKTRLRLGLPPQTMPRGAPDAGECILGLTEPVYVNEDSDGEPLAKHKKLQNKVKVKKEPELKVRLENTILSDTRSSRFKIKRPVTPPRTTRLSRNSKDDNVSLSRLQDKSPRTSAKSSPRSTPKSILKRESKTEDNSLLTPRLKRSREKDKSNLDRKGTTSLDIKDKPSLEIPLKRVKISVQQSSRPSKASSRFSVMKSKSVPSRMSKQPSSPSPPNVQICTICKIANKTSQGLANHMRSHTVNFTHTRMACNPCGVWFAKPEEAASHHKHHRNKSKPYTCRRCDAEFRQLSAYDEHLENRRCLPWNEVPDVKCDSCWHLFPTQNLLENHKCLGPEHRPGGKCSKCNRSYALLKNLKKHESSCTSKKRGELNVDPVLLGKLKPFQVRVSRCDPLLQNIKQEHYDVSSVSSDFGLDKNCIYPYISTVSSLRIKSEPFEGMVAIKDEIKDEFCTEEDFVHWDSEDSGSDEEISCDLVLNPLAKKKKIESLASLTLKTIFSKRYIGKVPRKRRRVKIEKSGFDSLLVTNETEDEVTRDINNIIDNLDNIDRDKNGDKSMDDFDSLRNDVGAVDDGEKNDQSNANESEVNDSPNVSAEKMEESVEKDVEFNKTDQNESQNNVSNSVCDGKLNEKDVNGASNENPNDEIKFDDETGSNNDLSSNNNDLTQIEDKVTVNNGTINNTSIDNKDSELSSHDKDYSNIINSNKDVESKVNNDADQNINFNDESEVNDDASSTKNDDTVDTVQDIVKTDIDSQDSSSIGTLNESLLNDNTQSNDAISEKENDNSAEQEATENVEKKSLNDDISDNLSQDSKISDSELNLNLLESKTNDSSSTKDEERSLNSQELNEDSNNAINVNKDKITEELDDKNLMAALDAQIGDSNDSTQVTNKELHEKIGLEDLISSKNSEKGMELDMIPDEFNFDT